MKLGRWEIYLWFLYYRMPEDWDDLDVAMKESRPYWNNIGIHLSYERTDEWYMLEIRFSWKYGARAYYAHFPAYWLITTCDCDECRRERRRIRIEWTSNNRLR